jgi:DNA polymerase IIIc chi subunit
MSSIHILKAKTTSEKLSKLCQTIQKHFESRDRILITAPTTEAANYLNSLLWRSPLESFLPHQLSEVPCDFPLVITTSLSNLNEATVLFNLLATLHPIYQKFETIYEIFDASDSAKEKLSQQKLESYRALGAIVI